MTKDQTPSREEVIRWAREAELPSDELYHPNLERFAALVAAAEREACARVCEAEAEKQYDNMDIPLTIAADLIRARKENT